MKVSCKTRIRCLFLIAVTQLGGCGTICTLSEEEPRNKIYSGTIDDLTDIWGLSHSLFLDLPLSFALDTMVLPYTIPKTIFNHVQDARGKIEQPVSSKDESSSGD